ncbi:MAG: hypothetical protein HRT74_09090, partial [Flavobacteriales bacterium]|nr:hypothetical protein [Flavobacteriales bacterium]
GKLPVDNYRWEAKVNIAGRAFVERGEFSIAPVQLEMSNLTADHQLLNLLSSRNGGEMVLAKDMQLLPAMIQNNNDVVSIAYEKKTLLDIIEIKWLLGLFLLFLAAEWLIRKSMVSY